MFESSEFFCLFIFTLDIWLVLNGNFCLFDIIIRITGKDFMFLNINKFFEIYIGARDERFNFYLLSNWLSFSEFKYWVYFIRFNTFIGNVVNYFFCKCFFLCECINAFFTGSSVFYSNRC